MKLKDLVSLNDDLNSGGTLRPAFRQTTAGFLVLAQTLRARATIQICTAARGRSACILGLFTSWAATSCKAPFVISGIRI